MLDSFRTRLALSNLLITLAGLLIVIAVFVNLLDHRTEQVRTQDLETEARGVALQVERLYARQGTPANLHTLVNQASNLLQKRIIIVGQDGQPVADSAHATHFYTGSWHPLNATALRAGQQTIAALHGGSLVTLQQPIAGTSGRRNGGAVLLVARVADVRPSRQAVLQAVLIALGTALVVWFFISLYFTYSVSQPLLRIRAATRSMARGDYDVRVSERGPGEIARLASSFNLMAAQVRQTNQVLRDFVANVSHDLRTPLTMIAGFSEALLDGTAGPDEVQDAAEIIHQEAGRMQALVDDLLQLTRLESGLLVLDRHPTQVRPFVQQVIDRVARAHAGQVRLINAVPEGVPAMVVDPTRLERALANLLINAVQYTGPGGTVTVRARETTPGQVEICVEDTGCGIPASDLPRIFERFYRADKSRERGHGHSGLGLAIVREIVEAHGGAVQVQSEEGRGSTFRFTVPAVRALRMTRIGRAGVR